MKPQGQNEMGPGGGMSLRVRLNDGLGRTSVVTAAYECIQS